MNTIKCAICADKERIELLYPANLDKSKIDKKTFSARRMPDRIHYEFVKCRRCGLIFSRKILPQSKIVNLYKESDFYYSEEAKYLGKTYLNYFKKYIGTDAGLKVLDIGAGNGFFLLELLGIGIKDVWGIEPGKPSINKSSNKLKGRIKPDILKAGLFAKSSFDVICCFHTLDHIVDPNSFLKVANSLLKPGGKVFFVVHNTNGLSVKIFGEKSPIFDIEHIFLFNRQSLSRIFIKNGFKKTTVFSHFNTYPLLYWMRLVPFPKKFKIKLLKILKQTRVGNLPIKINPGNIGIIAQK